MSIIPGVSPRLYAGIMLAAASAGALNNFWDRDIDAIMNRTRGKATVTRG
jgi:heme O synthase-like polyprenyltransferase